jgi:hypothetical protein
MKPFRTRFVGMEVSVVDERKSPLNRNKIAGFMAKAINMDNV